MIELRSVLYTRQPSGKSPNRDLYSWKSFHELLLRNFEILLRLGYRFGMF